MGDDQDFYAFFNATLPVLFRALLVVTADRELATDAAAEALSRAWQRWPELHNPRAWVWQVAYNHVRAWWRRIGKHEVLIGVLDEDVELTAGALAAAAPAAAEVDLDLLRPSPTCPRSSAPWWPAGMWSACGQGRSPGPLASTGAPSPSITGGP
jgi:DNA-directed RNA polymerase specialized sigma24 family protein